MTMSRMLMGVAVLGLLLGACATNDEALAERDRIINEKTAKIEMLNQQLADSKQTQTIMDMELEKRKDEAARARQERDSAMAARNAADELAILEAGARADLQRELEALRSSAPAAVQAPEVSDIEGLEVLSLANGDFILRLSDLVTFSSGSADLTRQGQSLVSKVAEIISRYPGYRISVEGHTDDTPLKVTAKRWRTNMNLSIARAQAVRNMLSEAGSIPETRMRVVGYGETRPLIAAATKEARARNRRVEVVLYDDGAD